MQPDAERQAGGSPAAADHQQVDEGPHAREGAPRFGGLEIVVEG